MTWGSKAVELLDPLPADTEFLQVDPVHETGRVTVGFERRPARIHHSPARRLGFSRTFGRVGADLPSGPMPSASAHWRSAAWSRGRPSRRWPRRRKAGLRSRVRCEPARAVLLQRSGAGVAGTGHGDEDERRRSAAGAGLLGLQPSIRGQPGALRTGAERLLEEFPTLKMVAVTRGGAEACW